MGPSKRNDAFEQKRFWGLRASSCIYYKITQFEKIVAVYRLFVMRRLALPDALTIM